MSADLPTSPRPSRLGRLADLMFRRRRIVLAAWIVALVAAFAASGSLAGEFSADYATPGSESQRAGDLLGLHPTSEQPDDLSLPVGQPGGPRDARRRLAGSLEYGGHGVRVETSLGREPGKSRRRFLRSQGRAMRPGLARGTKCVGRREHPVALAKGGSGNTTVIAGPVDPLVMSARDRAEPREEC